MAASLRSTRSVAKAALPNAWAEEIIGSQAHLNRKAQAGTSFPTTDPNALVAALAGSELYGPKTSNSYVRSQETRQRPSVPTDSGSVSRNGNWLHRVGDGALRRRSIKLLFAGSAFRVSVSGLVLCLNGGRRAQPGHVVRDRGSPPWLHPRRCAALRFLLSTA